MQPPTLSWTVNDVMRCFPMSVLLFNNLGVDTCCGGMQTLDVAAQNAGLSPDDLLVAVLPCTVPPRKIPTEPEDYVI
ncbi:MAG: DUF542 domain-containing protein [Gemmatimonadaceae bacterium]